MFSVVIPAHNEEALIGKCLQAMTAGARADELEIVVVANGCTDRTADVARSHRPSVRVIETEVASKVAALRLGDEAAAEFPRFYVDADVILPIESIRRVGTVLQQGPYQVASPKMRVFLDASSWAVRAYYDIWLDLPYHTQGMIGSGVYAVSKEGRGRFDVFPDIISDDGFVRLVVSPEERVAVEDAWFMILAPETLSGIVEVKTRSKKGALQLKRLYPELVERDVRDYRSIFPNIVCAPRRWPKAAVYLYVFARTKLRALWMNYVSGLGGWERDETSRVSIDRHSTGSREDLGFTDEGMNNSDASSDR